MRRITLTKKMEYRTPLDEERKHKSRLLLRLICLGPPDPRMQ